MSQRNNTKQQVKPFCKVCFDAGKTEAEYTTHFVKSEPGPKGVVVCPTLLSQPCTYCYTAGHTVSYCTVLKKDKKLKAYRVRVERAREFVKEPTKKVVNKNRSNAFSMLIEDSDEEECAPAAKPVEEYPSLTSAKVRPVVTFALPHSYAAMAGATATATASSAAAIAVPIEKPTVLRKIVVERRSWADWSDSDDDDDEEEE
jgi:hypothetical protein